MKTTVHYIAGLVFVSLTALTTPNCQAQSESSGCNNGHCHTPVHYTAAPLGHAGYRHFPRYGYGYGYRLYGYDRRFGQAELLRASAQANFINAHARTQNLHADRIQMENSVEFLATRLERKAINKQSRFGHLHERGEVVRQAKMLVAEQQAREEALNGPAGPVDRASGKVAWPILLRSSYYAKARAPINQIFHDRSVAGSINPDHYLPMRDWIEKIECELKANVAYYEMEDYLEAKAFLRELLVEARTDLRAPELGSRLAAR